ncbi:MAG: hypothetical protein ACKO91_08140 [Acidimicrobiales bacterium]
MRRHGGPVRGDRRSDAHRSGKVAYDAQVSGDEGYGLGWWVDSERPSYVQGGGAFGAVPWLDLERGYGACLVIESTARAGQRLASRVRPLLEPLIDRRAAD